MTATSSAAGSAPSVVTLESLVWDEEAPGIHSRATTLGGVRWAVVRYAAGAERGEWCTTGHRGFVLRGHIFYELAGGERLEASCGSGIWLPPGSAHRGVNGNEETQLFLIDVLGD
jgi:quercetin dioxygenase-like cupin family protein